MATIIITGHRGQLGRAIFDTAEISGGHQLIGADVDQLDITDAKAVDAFLETHRADYLVNCAAYTAVDRAEEEPEKAYAINSLGVKNLAAACERHHIRLIHISTDYVFSGRGCTPYTPQHPTEPESVYGQSKLEGEIAALYHSTSAIIIRTSWLYYPGGKNFVNTIIERGTVKKHLQVVSDQIGTPTYAGDLALAILAVVDRGNRLPGQGIYHYTNSGVASWFDFARAIVDRTGIQCTVEPISTGALNQAAKRPSYSVMDCSDIREVFQVIQPYWVDSLNAYLNHPSNPNRTI